MLTPSKEIPDAQLEELRPGPVPPVGPTKPFWRWDHGSCVAAKVIGKTVGLARKAQVVVTQLDYDNFSDDTWIDGLRLILDDIITKGRVKTAIVNFSIASAIMALTNADDPNSFEAGFHAIHVDRMGELKTIIPLISFNLHLTDLTAIMVRELIKMGVPVIAGAGNIKSPEPLGYPARFALKNDRWGKDGGFDNMIVVGQRHRDGTYDVNNPKVGPVGVDIYAPSGYIQCPVYQGGMRQTRFPPNFYDGFDGSSFGKTKYLMHRTQRLMVL